ncbi:MAG TPA: hypothetical protein VKV37_23150 [Ktedonobacteraceae bacterium]|nr:hypothetical protein [Ktedonobacteraceae bacterium]
MLESEILRLKRRLDGLITEQRTLYALPSELPAIDEVVLGYIHILEVTRLPSQCADLITTLRAFRSHYVDLLRALPQNLQADSALIPIRVERDEHLAFCRASLGYTRFWLDMEQPNAWRSDIVERVLAFHRRYLDRVLSAPLAFTWDLDLSA